MKSDKYLVLGNPIAHSKSPIIHTAFAGQTAEALEYDRLLVEPADFTGTIRRLQSEGIRGVNVTVPFKQDAYRIADECSDRAGKAGAVNTLVFREDGSIFADNTDGAGMVRDIVHNHRYAITDKRVLVLGAGGAVRGVLQPLIGQQPASITIANRTHARAEALQAVFKDDFDIKASGFAALSGQVFDLVINGTSLGLQGKVAPVPDGILAGGAVAYDMMYGGGSLPFQYWARQQGADATMDGLGMLVEQAAESFLIWRGVRPETAAVIHTLRQDG